jgi:L-aspartate oxidase
VPRRTDFLIIGSGIAGLRAAADLALAGDVLVLTKADPTESNTGYAQGGIAAAVGPGDAPRLHAIDTVNAGDGLCVDAAVDVLVEDGVRYVHELIEWGARFDRDRPARCRSVARARTAAAACCMPLMPPAARSAARCGSASPISPRVRVERNARVHELIVEGGSLHRRAISKPIRHARRPRRRVLLATGGAGQVFRETTNPPIATGDGVMLGWFAGAARHRSRVRPVSSDRARRAGRAAIPVSPKRCAARARSC